VKGLITIRTLAMMMLFAVGITAAAQAQTIIEDFDGFADEDILWGQQVGSGPAWNSSGANEQHGTAPLAVWAGYGVGGTNAVASQIAAEGSASINIPEGIRAGAYSVQVDINVSGDSGNNGDVEFRLATKAFANGENWNRDWVGPRLRASTDGWGGVSWHETLNGTFSLFSPSDGGFMNTQSVGWFQVKLEIDPEVTGIGAYFRDIDDMTGEGIGPWTGSVVNTTFFFDEEGVEIESVQLISQGPAPHMSFWDNLIVTGAGSSSFAGDFDGDGDVDGDDFLAWQNGFPTSSGAAKSSGDADGDGDVDGDDFLIWQNQFPSPGAVAATPEPASLVLLGLGALLMRRRNRV